MKVKRKTSLVLVNVLEQRRWHPERYNDGDEFALHLTSGIWITAVLVRGAWYGPGTMEVRPVMVTHWMKLPEVA